MHARKPAARRVAASAAALALLSGGAVMVTAAASPAAASASTVTGATVTVNGVTYPLVYENGEPGYILDGIFYHC